MMKKAIGISGGPWQLLEHVKLSLAQLATYEAAGNARAARLARVSICRALIKIGSASLELRGPRNLLTRPTFRTPEYRHPEAFVMDAEPAGCPFCESRELLSMPPVHRGVPCRLTTACLACDAVGVWGFEGVRVWSWISPLWERSKL